MTPRSRRASDRAPSPQLHDRPTFRLRRAGRGRLVSVIFVVLPVAIVVIAAAVGAYVWAARHGQFDDLETPAVRMLNEEEE